MPQRETIGTAPATRGEAQRLPALSVRPPLHLEATVRALARAIESGELSEAALEVLPTAAARERLIALPGVGPWSAAVVLLRGFGRLDVFPPGDAGALRSLRALLPTPADSPQRVIECFGERRGYLYFCLLGRSLLAKGLIHAAPPARRI